MRPTLDLDHLKQGMHALTTSAGGRLAECASVCLEERSHPETVHLTVGGTPQLRGIAMRRLAVTATMRACYDDLPEATEDGACGVAILLMKQVTGLEVVRRTRKGTGYDYCLGSPEPLDFSARLEVSGILQGTNSQVRARVREKREQIKQSDPTQGDLPAFAVIVEFSHPQAVIDRRAGTREKASS